MYPVTKKKRLTEALTIEIDASICRSTFEVEGLTKAVEKIKLKVSNADGLWLHVTLKEVCILRHKKLHTIAVLTCSTCLVVEALRVFPLLKGQI